MLTIRLGSSKEDNISFNVEGIITYNHICELLNKIGLEKDDITQCVLIFDKAMIKSDSNFKMNMEKEKEYKLVLLGKTKSVKEKLKIIFSMYENKDDQEEDQVEEDEVDEDEEEEQEMYKLSEETKTILEDEDFKTLLRIYNDKPELLSYLEQIISNSVTIEKKDIDMDDFNYQESLEMINNIIDVDEEDIKKSLIRTNGNVNLTLRELI